MKELSILFPKEYFHFYGLAGSLTGLMGGYCELIYTSTDYAEKDPTRADMLSVRIKFNNLYRHFVHTLIK